MERARCQLGGVWSSLIVSWSRRHRSSADIVQGVAVQASGKGGGHFGPAGLRNNSSGSPRVGSACQPFADTACSVTRSGGRATSVECDNAGGRYRYRGTSGRRRSTAQCGPDGAVGDHRGRVQRGCVRAGSEVRAAVDFLLRLFSGSAWRLAAAQQSFSTCVSARHAPVPCYVISITSHTCCTHSVSYHVSANSLKPKCRHSPVARRAGGWSLERVRGVSPSPSTAIMKCRSGISVAFLKIVRARRLCHSPV